MVICRLQDAGLLVGTRLSVLKGLCNFKSGGVHLLPAGHCHRHLLSAQQLAELGRQSSFAFPLLVPIELRTPNGQL